LRKPVRLILVVACLTFATAALAACEQAAPAPSPTAPPAAPTPAPAAPAAPTPAPAAPAATPAAPAAATPAAPAAAPTPAPAAAKTAFPEPGRTVTMIIPFAAGGGTDVQARILAPELERILGVSFSIVNRPGAGSQVGVTELTRARPDGYTLGAVNTPSGFMAYLDPDRQAQFGRQDIQPVANVAVDPSAVIVKADGPYRTLDDLIDAARANPEGIRAGTGGLMGSQHIATVLFEKAVGVRLASVHFEGGAPAMTAVLGDHVEATMGQVGESLPLVRAGNLRVLGVMARERSEFLPDVPTLEELGYEVYGDSSRGYSLPGGTPREIVQVWEQAIREAAQSQSFVDNIRQQGIALQFLGTEEYERYWSDYEDLIRPLIPDLKGQ
jgi:tripartite-type tricarboxylate transporter receptor subunit TctC